MISISGYSIQQNKHSNNIVITLPEKYKTITPKTMSNDDLIKILSIVIQSFESENNV